jgi:translation elongation factor EF-Tu-like GTPase
VNVFIATDIMYRDKRPAVRVRAILSVLASEEGGRRIDRRHSWRPNHNFGSPDGRSFYIGQVEFGSDALNPGETREVFVEFLDGPGLRENLQSGRTWRIQEGAKLIAAAKVVEVVGET